MNSLLGVFGQVWRIAGYELVALLLLNLAFVIFVMPELMLVDRGFLNAYTKMKFAKTYAAFLLVANLYLFCLIGLASALFRLVMRLARAR